ncbi:hypothetical protein PHLGIDRAFT_13299 [Phlebiopsis gigantea 11061_1 CR5-6]|uniref:Uncharacterized protein n=1 Tax=Phlebiopsis gigantea (strain 11061_1 CR5-6) TaxID=745531 RepID=A0A0C3S8F1_PHLG1|nr:hypothetical protein PHLGIDRAFT_13299 [Phlebiopsis gigantea 11061_1 CR5-6]
MAVDQGRPVSDSSPLSQRMAISSLITATDSTNHAQTEPVAAASGLSSIAAPGIHTVVSAGTVAASLPPALGPVATLSTSSPHTPATSGIITPSSGAYTLSASAGTSQPIPLIPPTIGEVAPSAVPMLETPSLQPESQTMDVDTPGDTLVTTLLPKITGIYDLAGTELESLVAGVIREDGFVKLLENLDSMWRIKILLGQ